MDLKKIDTSKLIEELESREEVQMFSAGLYSRYDVSIKRKYSEDRSPVQLPDYSTVLVIERT